MSSTTTATNKGKKAAAGTTTTAKTAAAPKKNTKKAAETTETTTPMAEDVAVAKTAPTKKSKAAAAGTTTTAAPKAKKAAAPKKKAAAAAAESGMEGSAESGAASTTTTAKAPKKAAAGGKAGGKSGAKTAAQTAKAGTKKAATTAGGAKKPKAAATKKTAGGAEGSAAAPKKAAAKRKRDESGDEQKQPTKAPKKRMPKDPNKPKGPKSAYICYANSVREQIQAADKALVDSGAKTAEEAMSMCDIAKQIGVQWNKLSAAEKVPFQKQAAKDKARHALEFEAWVPDKAILKMQKKIRRDRKDKQAPRKPMTAYMIYSNTVRSDIMQQNPAMKITEASVVIGEQWGQMSDEEKTPYYERADDARAAYLQEKQQYDAMLAQAAQ
jgi:hypothetical protein